MGHALIEAEAVAVVRENQPPRNPLTNPAPWITPEMLEGVGADGKVSGYDSGEVHRGTFYREFEGITCYVDETFLRVVIYGDETHDIETRIPIHALVEALAKRGQS